jgi:hypothetical protein
MLMGLGRTGCADAKGSCSSAAILWFRVTDRGTNTGAARCARASAPNALRERQLIGRGTHRKTCVLSFRNARAGAFSKGRSFREQSQVTFR